MLPAWCGLSGLDEAETGCGLMPGGELCALWLEGDLLCRGTLVCNQQGRVKAAPAGRWLSRLLNPEVMQLLNFV